MLNIEKDVKIIVTDFDGVLTDGFVYFSSVSDEEIKKLSFKDIMGISIALKNGYKVAIISGEKNYIIDRLAAKFNLEDVHQGIRDKFSVLRSISEKYNIPLSEICYIGDDINDISALESAGVAVTVPDANYKVKKIPNILISTANSGNGVFREVIDSLLAR
ncbi:MAG TPA: HAD hydrolase family protein [Candidatus Gastranaerophilales bacterium]|nr:HAD hydrolase family protein [Candidatus Gastranaerophilales bacterium]